MAVLFKDISTTKAAMELNISIYLAYVSTIEKQTIKAEHNMQQSLQNHMSIYISLRNGATR